MAVSPDVGMPSPRPQVPVLRGRVTPPSARGLRRERLVTPLVGPSAPRLVAVVAPPGCGKTTLLTHLAEVLGPAVAWLTLDEALGEPEVLLDHLHAACGALPWRSPPDRWTSVDDALAALETRLATDVVVVLDDVHTVDRRTEAQVLERLVRHQPSTVRLVLSSRTLPRSVQQRELAGTARVVDGEQLRFRTWEVEELFRACHARALPAAEVAELAQRTRGWAVGLELFHLATRDRPASSRGQLLGRAGSGPAVADYLAAHVLEGLPLALQEFLVRTSVLSRLSAVRCDALLGTDGSADLLAQAHREGLLTPAVDCVGTAYECHDVIRGFLLDTLHERRGGSVARDLHRRAAELADAAGEHDVALRSYCRAQDWDAARRVLAIGGDGLAGRPGPWIDLLPDQIRDSDPWVALALARRFVVEGGLEAALDAYAVAEARSASGPGRAVVVREQHLVRTWVDPPVGASSDWVALVRRALVEPRPLLGAGPSPDVGTTLASAVAGLVGGDVRVAVRRFAAVQARATNEPVVEAVALLGEAASRSLLHDRGAGDARERARTAGKLLGAAALERLAEGLELATRPGTAGEGMRHLRERCEDVGDTWGAALLGLLDVVSRLAVGTVAPAAARAVAARLDGLGAPALAAWASASASVAAAAWGRRAPADEIARVEALAAGAGPVPLALALLAGGHERDRAVRLARSAGVEPWLRCVARTCVAVPGHVARQAAEPAVVVRCLGEFALVLDGRPVRSEQLRPLHAALLRALCLHAPATVHRDRLVEWFWPGREPGRGQHSLQVAVSEVRRALDAATPAGGSLVRRVGHGYAFRLGAGASHDLRRVEEDLAAGRRALAHGDVPVALEVLGRAVDAGGAELLPQDGPADWVVEARDRWRVAVLAACGPLADLHAARGDAPALTAVARRGLALDRFQDGLWQQLVRGLLEDGRPAEAESARREYAAVLAELGVPGTPALPAARA